MHGLVSGRYQWVAFTSANAVRAVKATPAKRALQSAVPRPEARTPEDILNRYSKD